MGLGVPLFDGFKLIRDVAEFKPAKKRAKDVVRVHVVTLRVPCAALIQKLPRLSRGNLLRDTHRGNTRLPKVTVFMVKMPIPLDSCTSPPCGSNKRCPLPASPPPRRA